MEWHSCRRQGGKNVVDMTVEISRLVIDVYH